MLHSRFQSIHLKYNCSKISSSDCLTPLLGKSVIWWFSEKHSLNKRKPRGFFSISSAMNFENKHTSWRYSHITLFTAQTQLNVGQFTKAFGTPYLPLSNNVTLCNSRILHSALSSRHKHFYTQKRVLEVNSEFLRTCSHLPLFDLWTLANDLSSFILSWMLRIMLVELISLSCCRTV